MAAGVRFDGGMGASFSSEAWLPLRLAGPIDLEDLVDLKRRS